MAKNIVICCDGTGNEFGDNNSNVVKLYSTLIIDGTQQVGYYHPGVGTMGSPTATNKLSKAWSVLKGLAFGAGLLDNVGDAYRFLMNVYETGDNVFLFGFSRGAYTVRALAGVLRMFGLLCPGNEGLIPYITRLYAKRTRDAGGMTHTFKVAGGFKATFCRPCPLHFVGVWDTVSSVGWIWNPVQVPYTARNPDMQVGRHAVSIDERRCYFRNSLWGPSFPHQDIKQVWFAGVHSDVGGSYSEAESGLSKIALQWMLHEALSFGLLIDPQRADLILGAIPSPPAVAHDPATAAHTDKDSLSAPVAPNPSAPEHNSLTLGWWLLEFLPHSYFDPVAEKPRWRIPLGAPRKIPEGSVLHATLKEKLRLDPKYCPGNLPKQFTVEPEDSSPFSSKGIAASGHG
jgi:type VI secretion system (T6SS) phospholipase Tle1-like effector